MQDPKAIVREGYDRVSLEYRGDDEGDGAYAGWLRELIEVVPAGGEVLDLGCGNGIPTARWLTSRGYRVSGVDLSPVQVQRARDLVPQAAFECADMSSFQMRERGFDAVVAFYSIIHVPVEEQRGLLERIAEALRQGGAFMATLGAGEWTGTEDDWFGATMYWSHADRDTYLRWLEGAGLIVSWHRFVPEGDGGHTLVLARRTS